MEITDVRVYPVEDDKVRAFVSIVFDRCFMVNDIKIIRGKEGLFVSMPSRKRKNGDFKDVAHPLNSETRRWVEDRILGSFHGAVSNGASAEPVATASESAPASPPHAPQAAASAPSPVVASADAVSDSGSRALEELERVRLGDSFWGVG